MPQYTQFVVTNFFWCVYIQLASLFISLTLIIHTNVPLDKYIKKKR
jgi:hypothetical protein